MGTSSTITLTNRSLALFYNPKIPQDVAKAAVRRYMEIYDPDSKLEPTFEPNVLKTRWRKLVYITRASTPLLPFFSNGYITDKDVNIRR